MILEQFDKDKKAVIEPEMIAKKVPEMPTTVIGIFSDVLLEEIIFLLKAKEIACLKDIDGIWPIWKVFYEGIEVAVTKARLGAPACVCAFEKCISMGAGRIITLGNCGVLDQKVKDCSIIIPTAAIRDEGTSYHYMPSSDMADVNLLYRNEFKSLLDTHGYSYTEGVTWTTDAFYRETPKKIASRKEMGAVCVDMECSAIAAMCAFRNTEHFHYFYAADNLDSHTWEPRSFNAFSKLDEKVKIALLAFELEKLIRRSNKEFPL